GLALVAASLMLSVWSWRRARAAPAPSPEPLPDSFSDPPPDPLPDPPADPPADPPEAGQDPPDDNTGIYWAPGGGGRAPPGGFRILARVPLGGPMPRRLGPPCRPGPFHRDPGRSRLGG